MFNNLYVAYNADEDFRIMVVANSREEAKDTAREYFKDSGMRGNVVISQPFNMFDLVYSCDYVISSI